MSENQPDSQAPARARPSLWRNVLRIGFAVVVVALLLAYGMSFQVPKGHNAVVTRFGKPVGVVRESGLYWKLPWPIDKDNLIDMRLRLFSTPMTQKETKDKTSVILHTYAVWRVDDPLLFFTAGTRQQIEKSLVSTVMAAQTQHIGNYPLSALVSKDPATIQTDQLERDILAQVRDKANGFAVSIEQVGIKRIAYPEQNMAAALEHMKAERTAKALGYRAKGDNEAQLIRNKALADSKEIVKQGVEEAGRIRGQAEEQAAKIIEQAQSLDPEFYRFWRSLQLVKTTLGAKATIILRNDRGPFDVIFQEPKMSPQAPGAARDSAPGTPAAPNSTRNAPR